MYIIVYTSTSSWYFWLLASSFSSTLILKTKKIRTSSCVQVLFTIWQCPSLKLYRSLFHFRILQSLSHLFSHPTHCMFPDEVLWAACTTRLLDQVKWSEVNGLMVPTCSCSLVYRDIYNIFEVGADFSQGRKCLTPNALNPLTDLWRLIDHDGMKKEVKWRECLPSRHCSQLHRASRRWLVASASRHALWDH